jgi:hypothetical protein
MRTSVIQLALCPNQSLKKKLRMSIMTTDSKLQGNSRYPAGC